MVLLIIIPMKNGYFIGNIPNIFRQTQLFLVWKPLGAGFFSSQVIDQKHVTAVPQSTGQLSNLLWHQEEPAEIRAEHCFADTKKLVLFRDPDLDLYPFRNHRKMVV